MTKNNVHRETQSRTSGETFPDAVEVSIHQTICEAVLKIFKGYGLAITDIQIDWSGARAASPDDKANIELQMTTKSIQCLNTGTGK